MNRFTGRSLVLPIVAALFLGGCAETTLVSYAAKEWIRGSDPLDQKGIYKVGNPYQIEGVWYYPAEDPDYGETGIASWYGRAFHGRRTANGAIYDMNALTAAHRTLPMPFQVRVTNLDNGRSLVLTVNDRGPYARGRIIDVSRRAAQLPRFPKKGTALVRAEPYAGDVGRANAHAAHQFAAVVRQQEHRRRLGVHVIHDAAQRLAQRRLDIERHGEVLTDHGEQFEVVPEFRPPARHRHLGQRPIIHACIIAVLHMVTNWLLLPPAARN